MFRLLFKEKRSGGYDNNDAERNFDSGTEKTKALGTELEPQIACAPKPFI